MHKGRMEAFSDGVIAIIITIMVLELKAPHSSELVALKGLCATFLAYVISFIYVGIYWNNHHHLFQLVERVNGSTLWANLHLLFWLSLFPFVTEWMSTSEYAAAPVALYGVCLLCAGTAYYLLAQNLVAHHGKGSKIAKAIGSDFKGKISLVIYLVGIACSFWQPWVAYGFYTSVAIMWLIPDRRVERVLSHSS